MGGLPTCKTLIHQWYVSSAESWTVKPRDILELLENFKKEFHGSHLRPTKLDSG
jgi:hypothetical protein